MFDRRLRRERLDTPGPPPRYVHAMAYDAKRQRVILFGGDLAASPYNTLADTWEWDGFRWTHAGGT